MAKITPGLLEAGGFVRKLVVLPTGAVSGQQAAQLRGQLGDDTSILAGSRDLMLCAEASQIPVDRAAAQLIECRRDYAEFAARVQTRSDVRWTPLIALEKSQPESNREYATQVL
jgi:hypothetical protein